jgi:23S rRNA (cytidine2498-2'-O)-methyltransferase
VLDCVIIEPDQWWAGWHRVESVPQRWPGGVPKLVPADDMISRAYLKISEALLWSRLPAKAGDAFVEIGCSPGGSCQALLERGFKVMGVDPAPVDPRLLAMPNFAHQQKRGADVKRRDFRPFQWLTCDVNVAPRYTLDMVEDIVTHESAKIRGMLLTLKLLEPEMYGQIGRYVSRVQGWGYEHVRVRQLAFNRQEVCLFALKRKAMLRSK